jgi:imidazolonepropionase-like amidohydrolase
MIAAALLLAASAAVQPGPQPVGKAADTLRYVVLNHGRPAGAMTVARSTGLLVVRYAHTDRNRGRWLENRYRFDAAGEVVLAESRPMTATGQVGMVTERYEVTGNTARWLRSAADGGTGGQDRQRERDSTSPVEAGTFYPLGNSTAYDDALLARFLLRHPDRAARLLPDGTARLEIVAATMVPIGGVPQRLRLAVIHGLGTVPRGVWLDDADELAAGSAAWFITARPDVVPALGTLRALELAYRDGLAESRAAALLASARPAGPVVIRGGDVFDSENGVLLPRHTVVIQDGRITAVGPAVLVVEPTGATIINAAGRTVMPGMWDMHVHLQASTQSDGALTMLATGLTTVRDLAADVDVAVSYRDRVDAGRLIGPRALLAGMIEGPGAWAGPSDAIAHDADEALAWVRRYAALGYRQIKLYNLVHPDLVPVIAAEARRHGLRLSGHVPRGLSVPAAVRLGFDEINHAAFLLATFFQDSLYLPEMRPYSAVAAAVAPRFDADSPEVTDLIRTLREHRTVIDGTVSLWMGAGALEGRGSPGAASYARLLKRLWDAGVTLVAGTDNTAGSTYVTELELHQHAGIPATEVLRMATIIPARVMGEEHDYGSIAVGKVADIIIVGGRPTENVRDLRRIEHVIRAGTLYNPAALREAARTR